MKRIARPLCCFALVFLTHGIAHADWSEVRFRFDARERNLRVRVVANSQMGEALPVLAQKTAQAMVIVEKKLGLAFRDDVSVFFDDRPDFHNGLTTVLPTNRIYVHTEAPEIESSIGLERDFILETLVHEFGHMATLQQRGGVFSWADKVLGNASRPVGAWPRWLHEGWAVWTEEALGGRPTSGVVDLDRRRYAEYFARTGKHAVQNYDMDGGAALSGEQANAEASGEASQDRVAPGALPYHFGYLLLKAWTDRVGDRVATEALFHQAARSVGLSFRVQLRGAGLNIDQHFREQRESWAHTPLNAPAAPARAALAQGTGIEGPWSEALADGARRVTWIEARESGDLRDNVLWARDKKGSVSLRWSLPYTSPSQAYYLPADAAGGANNITGATERAARWLVLYRVNPDMLDGGSYDPLRPLRMAASWINVRGQRECDVPLPAGRVREITWDAGILGWIRSNDAGDYFAERATLSTGCALGKISLLAQSRARFERLSSLTLRGRDFALTRAPSIARGEKYETLEINGQRVPLNFNVVGPSFWRGQILASEYSRAAWAPVLISPPSKLGSRVARSAAPVHRLPLRTGAFRAVPDVDDAQVLVKEAFWDKDELRAYAPADFAPSVSKISEAPATEKGQERSELKAAENSATADTGPLEKKDYGVWPSLLPNFWLPSLAATTGGFLFLGETFYSDLSGRWAGASALGYDSVLRRPFFATSIERNQLGAGPFSSLGVSAYYAPVYNYSASSGSTAGTTATQDRWGARVSLSDAFLAWPLSGVRARLAPSLEYVQATRAGRWAGFTYVVPALSLGVQSLHGQRSADSFFHLSNIRPGFASFTRARFLKTAELYQNLQGQLPLGRAGISAGAEYGLTGAQNYPASYFEWGGLSTLGAGDASFLSRGFGPRTAAAREIVRGELQFGFRLATLQKVLSWNRLRVSHADMRWIAESVSWSHFTSARYRMGDKWYSSLGTEIDLWGAAAHYVNYKISFGAYRGFAPQEDQAVAPLRDQWRFAVIFRNALDL